MKLRNFATNCLRSLRATGVAVAAAATVSTFSVGAAAQEIQLTGPLAGAPACRNCRLYRKGRTEFALGPGFTLLDEYERAIFIAGRIQYNVLDSLGIGVFGGYAVANLNTDLTEKVKSTTQGSGTVDLPVRQSFDDQAGKLKWMAAPQVTFSPFRGKLALFQKIFVDTDLYVHAGAAFVGVNERKDCGGGTGIKCTSPDALGTDSRLAIAPTFGLGLNLYTSGLLSLNIEYRAFPFSWNRGGFDSRGGPPDSSFPDQKVDSEDRTFKFNQMIFLAAGFHFPRATRVSE